MDGQGCSICNPSLELLSGCVKSLGLEDSKIPDSKITASSTRSGSSPAMARLYNTPRTAVSFAHWSPQDNTNSYLQVR